MSLISCEKDLYDDAIINHDRDYNFKTISLNQVKSENEKVAKFVKKIQPNLESSFAARFDELYGFTVDTTNIIHVQKEDGYESFTFKVDQEYGLNYFKNLIITDFPDGRFEVTLTQFNLSKSLEEVKIENSLLESILSTDVLRFNNVTNTFSNFGCIDIGYYETVDACEGELVTPNERPECFNEDGSRATKEVFVLVASDCGFGAGNDNGGISVGTPPDTGGINYSGSGNNYSGIFIPNPYDGEANLNNPDFVFAVEVNNFIRTLTTNNSAIKNMFQANSWLTPVIINFMRDNGGLTQQNKDAVAFSLINVLPIFNLQLSDWTPTEINTLKYNAFYYTMKSPTIESQNMIATIVNSSLNGTLITTSPLFKYPIGSNYKILYPNFTGILEDIMPYAFNNNTNLLNIIHELTGVSTEQILEDLKWNLGAEIQIEQLGTHPVTGGEIKGLFNPSNPDVIKIDVDLVNMYETTYDPNNQTATGPLQALIIYSVILHELVHYEDFNFDNIMSDHPELGLYFESLFNGGYYEFNPNGDGSIIFVRD